MNSKDAKNLVNNATQTDVQSAKPLLNLHFISPFTSIHIDLPVEEKVRIAMSVGEEVISVDELSNLFAAKDHPIVYDGFEPSGLLLFYILSYVT